MQLVFLQFFVTNVLVCLVIFFAFPETISAEARKSAVDKVRGGCAELFHLMQTTGA